MEYAECYNGCDPFMPWLALVALPIMAFVGARNRAWPFLTALLLVPLLVGYTDGMSAALATACGVLAGVLAGFRFSPVEKARPRNGSRRRGSW